MSYTITQRSKKIAKENNLILKPSNDKKHKIDVFGKKGFIASIGSLGYADYPTYLNTETKSYADERKKLYRKRHKKDLTTTKGRLANLILWT